MKSCAGCFLTFLLLALATTAMSQGTDVKFNVAEIESMAAIFNQTTIKGSEVEIIVPLNRKLKEALHKAQAIQNKQEAVPFKLTVQEASICLNIINNATFEARYAELVFGMKKKLQLLIPSQEASPPKE